MSQELLKTSNLDEHRPWKRIGTAEIDTFNQKGASDANQNSANKARQENSILSRFSQSLANLFLKVVHAASRAANRPVVDIGQTYSVSTLNDRINQLEEILVRQWTNLKDEDYLTPNDEITQYVAACHIARQYDRITLELLSSRLGVSQNQAAALLDQMMEDEIITESYVVTYHDVRRAAIDVAIEHKLGSMRTNRPEEISSTHTRSSKEKH